MRSVGEKLVIVGAGHAGGRLANHLSACGYRGTVTLVGEERHEPYERPALSKEILVGSKSAGELKLSVSAPTAGDNPILLSGVAVQGVDLDARAIRLGDGNTLRFDQIVIATGGKARRLRLPGADHPRVLTLRTIDDALALTSFLPKTKRLAVVGGGVIGLEVASSARQRGIAVTVIEAGDRLMGRLAPPVVSERLRALHESAGVEIMVGTHVQGFRENGDGLELEAHSGDGSPVKISCDLALVAVGQDPSSDILDGRRIGPNGLPVDQWCRVLGQPDCFAIGDVANTYSPIYRRHIRQETWRNAENQSRALAEILTGREAPYVEVPWMWTDQHGTNIQVVGVWAEGTTIVERGRFGEAGSSCIFVEDGRITGGVLLDNGRERRPLEQLVAAQAKADLHHLRDLALPLRALVGRSEATASS